MAVQVKICGIRREEDVTYLNEFLPDYAGFVFAESRRQVTAEQAAALIRKLDSRVKPVGVFVNAPPEEAAKAAARCGLSAVQLHGDEDEAYIRRLRPLLPENTAVWKAVRVREAADIARADSTDVDILLLDSYTEKVYGGTGKSFNWSLVAAHPPKKPFFAAGGLTPFNIIEAIRTMHPFGIDISGGVEGPDGCKDRNKIAALMAALSLV